MFGHHEPAQATVLYSGEVTGHLYDQYHVKIEFVLEVRPPTGQAFRAKATHHFIRFTHYPKVGDVINVKYHPKSLEVSLDLKDDNRYGEKGLKYKEQARHQAEQARRDALLAAPPGTPLSSAISAGGAKKKNIKDVRADMQAILQQQAQDPDLQELMQLEEAERRAKQAREQQAAQSAQMPAGFPGMAAPVNPQAALGPAEVQRLRQELEYTGASGQAKILRKQQAGASVQHLTPFLVEALVQPDAGGFPFQCAFTTWIDASKGTLMEGYTLPVKYDPQNTARMVLLLPE